MNYPLRIWSRDYRSVIWFFCSSCLHLLRRQEPVVTYAVLITSALCFETTSGGISGANMKQNWNRGQCDQSRQLTALKWIILKLKCVNNSVEPMGRRDEKEDVLHPLNISLRPSEVLSVLRGQTQKIECQHCFCSRYKEWRQHQLLLLWSCFIFYSLLNLSWLWTSGQCRLRIVWKLESVMLRWPNERQLLLRDLG